MPTLQNIDLVFIVIMISMLWVIGILSFAILVLLDHNKEQKGEIKQLRSFLSDVLRKD